MVAENVSVVCVLFLVVNLVVTVPPSDPDVDNVVCDSNEIQESVTTTRIKALIRRQVLQRNIVVQLLLLRRRIKEGIIIMILS